MSTGLSAAMAALFLAGSFVFSIPSGALANWQYTHWGMSPDEVVKASNGKASLVPADVVARADKSYGRVKLAESTARLDNIPLNVGFIFSIETRSLVEVRIVQERLQHLGYLCAGKQTWHRLWTSVIEG